jgi:hypothetical protein
VPDPGGLDPGGLAPPVKEFGVPGDPGGLAPPVKEFWKRGAAARLFSRTPGPAG